MNENQNNEGMLRPFKKRHGPPARARINSLHDGVRIFLDPHILEFTEAEWVQLRDRVDLELGLGGIGG